jgi:hypothetical protein
MGRQYDIGSNFTIEKKVIIRNIEAADFPKINALQHICFPNMNPWKIEHLESHIRIFTEGHICVPSSLYTKLTPETNPC